MMAKVHKQHDSGDLFVLNIFERSIRKNISAFKLIQVCSHTPSIIVTTGNCWMQIKHMFSELSLLSHGRVQGGIQFSMTILGEACSGEKPSPCALLQNWHISKRSTHESSN